MPPADDEAKKRPNIKGLDDPRLQQLAQVLEHLAAKNEDAALIGSRTDIQAGFAELGLEVPDRETLQNWLKHFRKYSGGRLALRDRHGPYVLKDEAAQ